MESSSQSPESTNISPDAIEQHEAVSLPAAELLTDSLPPYPEAGIVEGLANEQVQMSSILCDIHHVNPCSRRS